MRNLFKRLKTERQAKYLRRLEEQRTPLTLKQFEKLCKMELPPETPFHEWMMEWSLKSRERQEREDAMVREFMQAVAERLKQQMAWEEIAEQQSSILQVPEPAPKPKRKTSAFRWLASTAAACVLCLAIVLPLTLGGDSGGGGDEKQYTALNARILGADDGVYFGELYDQILKDESLLIFNNQLGGMEGSKEIYNDETEELLSYVLHGMIADASAGTDLIVFTIDFRIRFVEQYKFAGYELDYEGIKDSKSGFSVGETEIKYMAATINAGESEEEQITYVRMSFTYGGYGYFLEIRVFEIEGLGVVTELNEGNLILLMENLIPHNEE